MTKLEASSELRRQLLERLRKGELPSSGPPPAPFIRPAGRESTPLSCGQQQIWLHSEFSPDAPIYNESITIRKRGSLDPLVLEAAFNEVIRRHGIWRTGFEESSGKNAQVVHPEVYVALPLVDLTSLSKAEAEEKALELASEDARRQFDLRKPPLLRARLIRLSDDDHRLYLTFQHLIFDGVSLYRVFLPELASLYQSYVSGRQSTLAALPLQYGDFAAWQQRKLANGDYARQLDYWRESLKGDAPAIELPAGAAQPPVPAWQAGMETFVLPSGFAQSVKRLAANEGASLYMTLLAAFHILLHRYSGQQAITTGAVVSTRNRPELESLIGFVLNTLVLRSHVDSSISFREFLHQVRDTVLNALANSEVPFDAVVRELAPKRRSSRNALFQILFSLRPAAGEFPEGWDLTEFDVHSGASGFDLFVDLVERPDGLKGRIIYCSALFDQDTIKRMIGHFETLLEGITSSPEKLLAYLPLLTDPERQGLLDAGSGPTVSIPPTTISGMFEQTAARCPERHAVRFQGNELSFGELDERANVFAARLRHAGAGPGRLISVSVERSLELVVALVAILKTGSAYLPIDLSLPEERQAFILGDAKPDLRVDSTELDIASTGDCDGVCSSAKEAGLAYVLYTSGSTGVPKGVAVPESAVVSFLRSMQREPGFAPDDILLAITTLSFDIAVLEIFLPLITGGTLVIAPRRTVTDPLLLTDAIRDSGCTVMQGTPAVWRALIDAGWQGNSQLKVLCGGEALSRGLANRILPRCRELWNMYGPTETTIWSTVQKVEPGNSPISIGHPIDNTQVYVLDPHLQLLPIGVKGELYIGGSGVARGYIDRPALTSERFLSSPFRPGERIYRTGDLARILSDGSLETLGRIDDQVKIRGYRVELQEIEEALAKHPGVLGAAVKPWRDASDENSLVAYLVGHFEVNTVRAYLARKLPDYMIPSRFIELPSLPLTPNGKLDRKALSAPVQGQTVPDARTGPRNDTELRVAKIWSDLLHANDPDIHEDFFNVGGHSLLAATMLRSFHQEFGVRLSISALFENPTIAGLSTLLGPGQQKNGNTHVGPPSLYWMYAGAYCRHLASHLRPDYRLDGVSLPGEIEVRISEADRLEDVARLIAEELRNNGKGPYNIAGWCISGILAYEVAVQLKASGEEVGVVALVGAPNPQHYSAIPNYEKLKSKARHHWKHLRQLDLARIPRYLLERSRYQLKQRNPLRSQHFERILLELALRYEPNPLDARVILFQGADRPSVVDYSPGWTSVVKGKFSAYDVPGNHVTSLEEPNVGVLAEKIKECLNHRELRTGST